MGVGSGYTQEDVQELARILTGVGVNFQPQDPNAPKPVAAQPDHIRNGPVRVQSAPPRLRRQALPRSHHRRARLRGGRAGARHPRPPPGDREPCQPPARDLLRVRRAARSRWCNAWRRHSSTTDGDIASVLLVMFKSPEFNAIAARNSRTRCSSCSRRCGSPTTTKVISIPRPILDWLNRMAQGLYDHPTPDGYPMTAAAWNGPGQMAVRFEIARQIGVECGRPVQGRRCRTRSSARRSRRSQTRSITTCCSIRLSPATRAALDQATSPQEWNTLFLSSPEFMR